MKGWLGLALVAAVIAGVGVLARGRASLPDVSLLDLSGRRVELATFRGRVVLLNVWATWCQPCAEELPTLDALERSIDDRDFVVLAVSADERPWKVAPWIEQHGYTLPVLLDPRQILTGALDVSGYPETFLVDREGHIVHRHRGFRDWSDPGVVRAVKTLIRYGSWIEPT